MKAEGQIPGCLTASTGYGHLYTDHSFQVEVFCCRGSAQRQYESRKGEVLIALPRKTSLSSLAIIHCLKLCLPSVKSLKEPAQDGITV